ncbi:MAG TPA: polymer-forming cytoskeletal protein [Candidatus Paceibacterota bacterium]|nr:polymer-forming cytoskeletal protein [Candidatus Paceibacterota bacterium]
MNGNTNGDNVIQKGTEIKGIITFSKKLIFAGILEGQLISKNGCQLEITKDAHVKGEIIAPDVQIDGEVNAVVTAKTVGFGPNARVTGDVNYERIIATSPTAQLTGKLIQASQKPEGPKPGASTAQSSSAPASAATP